jgi:hypothetical protein
MSIAATHDGTNHVRLRVTPRQGWGSDAWQASATVIVDAGEELRDRPNRASTGNLTSTNTLAGVKSQANRK